MTLLMYALIEAAVNKDEKSLKIVTELVKTGADSLQNTPDYGSSDGVMPSPSSPAYIKALVEGGLVPNTMDDYQPLIFNLVTDHSLSARKYLLSVGADINKTDSDGNTVLTHALAGMELDVVRVFVNSWC